MARLRIALVALMLVAAPSLADSVVSYQLQLGGDNHAASIQSGTRVAYSPGSADDGPPYQSFPAGVLDWATTIQVAGLHSQPSHPSDGLLTQGVANFVFNLRLETLQGALVTNVDYYSTIHDGASGLTCSTCAGGYIIPGETPFCSGAAFAYSFSLGFWGPGRAFEAILSGVYTGPFMEVGMYPTVDVGNISGDGQLLGMGAGYGRWSRGGGYSTRTSKGVGQTVAEGGWGIVPVVEGQIDTSGLPAGTYVLKLVPGTGTNVLRGDVDLVSAPAPGTPEVQAFAVPANQAIGDDIIFEITASATPPAITALQSVKDHGTPGLLATDLPVAGDGTECRDGGPTQLLVTFDQNVQGVGGLGVEDVSLSGGGGGGAVTGVSITDNVLTVDLTGVANATALTVGFPGIENASAQACTETVCLRALKGDVNASGSVDVFDLVALRDNLNTSATAVNCRYDINLSSEIDVFDLVAVRDVLNTNAPACQ